MKWRQIPFPYATRRDWAELRKDLQKLSDQQVKTRADLDAAIAALPGIVSSGVTSALSPILTPIVDKLKGIPTEDFSTEVAALQGIPAAIEASVSLAVSTTFNPPATTTSAA